jgi:hypothetical protein
LNSDHPEQSWVAVDRAYGDAAPAYCTLMTADQIQTAYKNVTFDDVDPQPQSQK